MVAMCCTSGLRTILLIVLGLGLTLAACPDNTTWVPFDGSCYRFGVGNYKNFFDAEMSCRKDGGQLIHVDNTLENEFIKKRLVTLNSGNYWIGLTDFLTEGSWVFYANNETVSFFDWSPGEPNSFNNTEEDCAGFFAQFGYKWVDAPCDTYLLPPCEITSSSNGAAVVG